MSIRFPFELKQANESVSYPTSSNSTILDQDSFLIQGHHVDQELYLFKGKKVGSSLKLLSLQTKIRVSISQNFKGEIYRRVKMEHLSVEFEADKATVNLILTQEGIGGPAPSMLYFGFIFGGLLTILLFIWSLSLSLSLKDGREVFLGVATFSFLFAYPFLSSIVNKFYLLRNLYQKYKKIS